MRASELATVENPVHEAMRSRRSIRRFLDKPVPRDALNRIIESAIYAPSGHNIQPWKLYVVSGETKANITAAILKAAAEDDPSEHQPEYEYYPTEWFEPYLSRRRALGYALYERLGIDRADKAGRRRQMLENFKFFGAPVGMFVSFDRRLETGTFMDIGMFIQSILIGARAEGLATCGQAAFCWYHKIIRAQLGMEDTELLACGLSLGYADPDAPENAPLAEKLRIEDFTTFLD